MNYIDATTGATYPLGKPRWCGDGGGHLNLGDAPGLTRNEIDTTKRSVWRYARALTAVTHPSATFSSGMSRTMQTDSGSESSSNAKSRPPV